MMYVFTMYDVCIVIFLCMMYVLFSLPSYPPRCPPPPLTLADPEAVRQAVDALTEAKRPLVVIGKGSLLWIQ